MNKQQATPEALNKARQNGHSPLLTPMQAAEQLGVTPHTLSVWRCTNRYPLRYVRVGRLIRYRQDDIEAFISAGCVGVEVTS